MKPSVGKAGMVRLGASFFGILALVSPALAGDRASLDFIGYSDTGQYFAFTEMGVQDGAGFAYANVYVLDVTKDEFVGGAPFKVQAEDEYSSVYDVQKEALAAAAPVLDKFDIGYPVDLWAVSGDGVEGIARTLDFGVPGYMAPKSTLNAMTLKIETFEAASDEPCKDYTDQPILGFSLALSGETWNVVHKDERIPASRNCPIDYSIFAVVTPMEGQDLSNAVAVVSVYSLGFEGPNRRFIAVPLTKQ